MTTFSDHLGGDQDGDDAAGSDAVICSARGCRRPAAWAVVWNNPRIHPPDREKVWAACAEHREYLSDYLGRRGMLRRVDPLDERAGS